MKRGIRAVCLLAAAGLIWLGAGDGILPGESVPEEGNEEYGEAPAQAELPEEAEQGDSLKELILQVFSGYGNGAKDENMQVERVSWEREELAGRLWGQLEEWQNTDEEGEYGGYIELLAGLTDKETEGTLQEYATIQGTDFQYTYLATDSGIYEIRTQGSEEKWRSHILELLCSVPQWQISEEAAQQYIHTVSQNRNFKMELYYNELDFHFYSASYYTKELLEYECWGMAQGKTAAGQECLWFRENDNGQEAEWLLSTAETLPVYDTYGELREYLQTLYPDLCACAFYTYKTGQYCDCPIIILTTKEAAYGYFPMAGWWYQICADTAAASLSNLYYNLDYDYQASYSWSINAEGYVSETDLTQGTYYFETEIYPAQIFAFACRETEREEGEEEILPTGTYEIAVSVLGMDQPFQVFETASAERSPFSFEDFNADGYQDLKVLYYYGVNGGTASHYLWSPSKGQFIRAPIELDEYGAYGINQEKRQLSLYRHGSSVSGTNFLYQWSGEADYELIRYFDRNAIYDYTSGHSDFVGVQIYISVFEGGQEKVLSDYLYLAEEYSQREEEIFGIYTCDFVWEQEILLEEQEQPCILRYAQTGPGNEETENREEAYRDQIYLFREDTYLICVLKQETGAAYEELSWDGEIQELAVRYADGTERSYRWEGGGFIPWE